MSNEKYEFLLIEIKGDKFEVNLLKMIFELIPECFFHSTGEKTTVGKRYLSAVSVIFNDRSDFIRIFFLLKPVRVGRGNI